MGHAGLGAEDLFVLSVSFSLESQELFVQRFLVQRPGREPRGPCVRASATAPVPPGRASPS
eukprot:6528453-Alexandrium_andersonii.AAC.1